MRSTFNKEHDAAQLCRKTHPADLGKCLLKVSRVNTVAEARDVQVVAGIVTGLATEAPEVSMRRRLERGSGDVLSVGVTARSRAAAATGAPGRDVGTLSVAGRGSVAARRPCLMVELGAVRHGSVAGRDADTTTVGCGAHLLGLPG